MLLNERNKRLGDLLAGTVVLQERVAARGGAVAEMPPPLAGWAAGLDLSRLPDGLALSARLRRLMAAAADAKDLVEIGAYVPGTDPVVDEALGRRELIEQFLQQPVDEVADPEQSWARLSGILS